MHVRHAQLVVALSVAISSCSSKRQPSSAAPPVSHDGRTSTTSYAPSFPLFTESELEVRKRSAQLMTPGWSITLDRLGMLCTATCEDCEWSVDDKLAPAERSRVESFLTVQSSILALDGPGVVRRPGGPGTLMRFEQVTPLGIAAEVYVERRGHKIVITGHAWPELPRPGLALDGATIDQRLRARDPSDELIVDRHYRPVVRVGRRSLEIHEAACLYCADATAPVPRAPSHPLGEVHLGTLHPCVARRFGANISHVRFDFACVDLRTGEDLTRFAGREIPCR
jgi:hypothetical protein